MENLANEGPGRQYMGMSDRDGWLAYFPPLIRLEPEARRCLCDAARTINVPAGTRVFQEGSPSENYMLVLDGSVRVQKVSESGREIVLYRVESGQSCVLTTICLINREEYGAEGFAETPVTAIILPAPAFEDLLAHSATFRRFVFSSYATRVSDLLMLIEEVAFGRIDVRLAQLLIERAADGQIAATHQE